MSRFTDDRLLWLIVGASLLAASRIIPAALEQVRSLTEVHEKHEEEESQKFNRESELALKPETLRVLADGPSYELRVSAIKIVAARCLNDDHARKILLRDLTSKKPQRKAKALSALSLLLFHRALLPDRGPNAAEVFSDEAGFKAVIDALINCLPLHEEEEFEYVQKDICKVDKPQASRTEKERPRYPPGSPIRPPRRPPQEMSLMEILFELLSTANRNKPNLSAPLSAGLITRWLNVYPFPCASPLNAHLGFRRSDVVSLLRADAWASDDPLMGRIMHILTGNPDALKQLRTCGLRASNYTEALRSSCGNALSSQDQDQEQDQDVLMTNSEDTAGVPVRPSSSWARQAPSRSHEEESLRRRHREAIVVADRGTPFSRDNILQRQNSRVGPTPLSMHDLPSPRTSDLPPVRAGLLSRMASTIIGQSTSGPATTAIPPPETLTELVQISETDIPVALQQWADMDSNTQMALVREATARDRGGIEVDLAELALARRSADGDPAGEVEDNISSELGAGTPGG